MDLTDIFDEPDLAVLRLIQNNFYEDVTLTTPRGTVELTCALTKNGVLATHWLVHAYLPDEG